MSTGTTHNHPTSNDQPRRQSKHPVLTIAVWVFGIGAVAVTALLVAVALAVVNEWSGYVGGESTTALFTLGFLALVTVIAWAITWALIMARRH